MRWLHSLTRPLEYPGIRDGFFPFSLSSILTLGTILATRSLFHFFFQKELW